MAHYGHSQEQRLHASVGEVTEQFHLKSKAYVQIMYTQDFPTKILANVVCCNHMKRFFHNALVKGCVSRSLKGFFLEREFFLHVIPFLMFSVRCTHLMGTRGKLQPSSTWTFTSELMDGESGWITPTLKQSNTKRNAMVFFSFFKMVPVSLGPFKSI